MNFQAGSDLKRRVLTAIALPLVSNTISCNQEMDLAGYWSILEWQETLSGFSGSKRKSSCMAWMRRRSNKAGNKTAAATIQSDAVSAEDNKKLNKTETLNKLDEMIKASAAAEGDEKKMRLRELREFIVDKKEFFESEMSDEELDRIVDRLHNFGFSLQEFAVIMTSLSNHHRWSLRHIGNFLRELDCGDEEKRSTANLNAMIEILKCDFIYTQDNVFNIRKTCFSLGEWAQSKGTKTFNIVGEIVRLARNHTFNMIDFMKEYDPKWRAKVCC